MTKNLSCTDTIALLHDYLDDALSPIERQGALGHLQECPACRLTARELRCTRRLLRRLPREPMPDPMKHTILDALRSRPRE